MAFKWKRDKENKNTVKIMSDTGSEIGELKLISIPEKNEIRDFNK